MRAILLDELTPIDMDKVRDYMAVNSRPSAIADLYWVEMDAACLTGLQAEHSDCGPHRFAVETGDDFVKIELFIRPADGLRCHCAGYAEDDQRQAVLAWVDRLMMELSLQT